MGSIYSQASLVVCWLGKAEDNSHLAFSMLEAWGDVWNEIMEERGLAIDWNGIWECDQPAFVNQVLDRIRRRLNHPFDTEGWKAVFGEDQLSWTGFSGILTMDTSPVQRRLPVPAGYTEQSTLAPVIDLTV